MGHKIHDMRDAAVHVVHTLQLAGHEAYFAGGCVRDQIMGDEPSDYDVATDAPPARVRELFRRARLVGQAFGVVMVGVGPQWIEVATFRTEWGYEDHRHPDHVEFSDAEHDARRRDFTINGLFYDPIAQKVIDYVDGQADIERRIIRAIGEPQRRFEEDYLRMVRAARFGARLGFAIEPATAQAIREHAPRLSEISRERIGQELQLILEHPRRAEGAALLHDLLLDGPMLDEPPSSRRPLTLSGLPADASFPLALAAWMIDRHLDPHPPADVAQLHISLSRLKLIAILRRWRRVLALSNEQRDATRDLLKHLPVALDWPQLDVPRRKRLLARDDWPAIRLLLDAVNRTLTHPADLSPLDAQAAALFAEGVAPTPLITGDDLIAAGFAPGPAFKVILEKVYDAQLGGEISHPSQALELAAKLNQ